MAGAAPSMVTVPASGFTSPMMALNKVDLPEPFMPTRPQIRPFSSLRRGLVQRQHVPVVDGHRVDIDGEAHGVAPVWVPVSASVMTLASCRIMSR